MRKVIWEGGDVMGSCLLERIARQSTRHQLHMISRFPNIAWDELTFKKIIHCSSEIQFLIFF